MLTNKRRSIYTSLLIAFICLLLPWTGFALQLRPDFMLLVLIFWLIRAPNLCNIGSAWMVGLLVDLANGGTFGQYALAYTITAFFAAIYQRRLVLFNSTQQLFYVFLLLLIAQLSLLLLKTFVGEQSLGWSYFLPSLSGVILWQIAVILGLKTGGRSSGS